MPGIAEATIIGHRAAYRDIDFTAWGLWGAWLACCCLADWLGPQPIQAKLWGMNALVGTTGLATLSVVTLFGAGLQCLGRENWPLIWHAILGVGIVAWFYALTSLPSPHLQWCGFMGDPDQFGLFMAIVAIVAWRYRVTVLVVGAVVGVVGSGSRGAILALVCGALPIFTWRALVAAPFLGMALLLSRPWSNMVFSTHERINLLGHAIKAVWRQPSGYGHMGWLVKITETAKDGFMVSFNDRAHIIFVDWALIGGIGGALAMTALCARILWRLRDDRWSLGLALSWMSGMLFLFPTWPMDIIFMVLLVWSARPKMERIQ